MHRRKPKKGYYRGHGVEDYETITSIFIRGLSLLLVTVLVSCTSTNLHQSLPAKLCMNGEGFLKIISRGTKTTMRMESRTFDDRWAVGLSIPMVGEIPVIFNDSRENNLNSSLMHLLGFKVGEDQSIHKYIKQTNKLFFDLYRKNFLKPVKTVRTKDLVLIVTPKGSGSHDQISHYQLGVMRHGYFWDSKLVDLEFIFKSCDA